MTIKRAKSRKNPPKYRLGIDLGGTKIYAVVIDAKGRVIGSSRRPTKGEIGYRGVLKRMHETAGEAAKEAGIKIKAVDVVGIGVPGPVDMDRGRIHMAANLGWGDKDIGKDFGALIDRPIIVGNDVNCGGLGEAAYGAAHDVRSAFLLFPGTGLGAAVLIDGKVVNGQHGYGGEIGHIPAPFGDALCGCGRRGCLETVASKTGISRLIAANRKRGMRCKLMMSEDGKLRSSDLKRAWDANCPCTRAAITDAARALAWGMAVVGGLIDPQVFVFGGGVIEALHREMLPIVRDRVREISALYRMHKPDIRIATLGDDAVAVGAAVAGGSV